VPETQIEDGKYVFDNENVHSVEQHRCLAAAYDPMTTSRLAATGVSPGWRCWEVGAGGGSVAHWLADRVVPTGSVLATDIKPHHVRERQGVTRLRHDVVADPVPRAGFDLIHSRLVLLHLPERLAVLEKLAGALNPGGWMQLDEFDISYGPSLLTGSDRDRHLYEKFLAAKVAVMDAAGADGCWGRRVGAAMRKAGLVDIDPQPRVELWDARSPGLQLLVHHTYHLRDQLIAVGMTDRELAGVRAVMADPSFLATSCLMYSVQGRRPETAR
jgi:SAM-dependent methyltransferase